jgi:DNA-binding transcriptional LysR family regulator
MTFPNLERGRVWASDIVPAEAADPARYLAQEGPIPDLNALVVFAKVVEANSFSEAARRLTMPISTVSRRIAELEDALGARLLDRSTRSLRLTELGAEVLEQAIRSAELSDAVDNIVSNRLSTVCGTLRLSAPPTISDTLLTPIVTAFQASYPDVRVQIFVTDRHIDHIAEGIDLAFRLGVRRDSSLVARKVLAYRRQLVASPDYLKSCRPPEAPNDLLHHPLLAFWRREPEASWSLVHKDGRAKETITFRPYLAMNDFAGLTPAMLAGRGIGELPPVVQPELIRTGRLVEVMPDWRFPRFDLSLVHLGNRHLSKACRIFKEFAAQMAQALFPDLPS